MSDSIVSYCNVTLSVVLGHDAWFLCLMTRVCRQWSRAMSDPLVWRRICIADPHHGGHVSHRFRMWQHLFDNTSDDGDICYMVTRPLHQPPLRHILSRAQGGLRELYICAMLGESELLDVLPARAARHLQVLKMAALKPYHSGHDGPDSQRLFIGAALQAWGCEQLRVVQLFNMYESSPNIDPQIEGQLVPEARASKMQGVGLNIFCCEICNCQRHKIYCKKRPRSKNVSGCGKAHFLEAEQRFACFECDFVGADLRHTGIGAEESTAFFPCQGKQCKTTYGERFFLCPDCIVVHDGEPGETLCLDCDTWDRDTLDAIGWYHDRLAMTNTTEV